MIDISINGLAEIQKALKDTPQKVNQVLARAVNRAATNARSNMSKEARKQYLVKASDIKETIKISNATAARPYAIVKSEGKRIDLVNFGLRPKVLFKGQHNYSVQVTKSGGLKPVPGFAAASNKWGLFKRTGAGRYPISRLMGPSVPQMIGRPNVIEEVERDAKSMLDKRILHELERLGITPK